jgi:hypothetical protein
VHEFQVVNINNRKQLAAQDVDRDWSKSKLGDLVRKASTQSPEKDAAKNYDRYSIFCKIETGQTGGKVSVFKTANSSKIAS